MNVKALILLVLQIAIAGTVFSYGLQARREDLLYVVGRPGLLLRSLVAMLVVMPLLVVACVYYLDLPQPTAVVLSALAISPVPPLLPKKENEAAVPRYGLGGVRARGPRRRALSRGAGAQAFDGTGAVDLLAPSRHRPGHFRGQLSRRAVRTHAGAVSDPVHGSGYPLREMATKPFGPNLRQAIEVTTPDRRDLHCDSGVSNPSRHVRFARARTSHRVWK
ncbi:hypothetical protein [Paraburkholderia sp. HD33-4]|uniref:hypothetical protein n=1 Tax=Paraburkholderia sp. HD33-4 TaxID=2883242 RepID=UPI001F4604C0|nr:hypothetical protein [Paraburkholderia sp. HD33-4]